MSTNPHEQLKAVADAADQLQRFLARHLNPAAMLLTGSPDSDADRLNEYDALLCNLESALGDAGYEGDDEFDESRETEVTRA